MDDRVQVRIRWTRMWWPMLLIIVFGLVVYSNTWHSPFVFDDIHTIVENDARRTLSFTVDRWFGNRTLSVFSFDLNYYINGLDVVGYHAVNIGIHIITAVGVWWLAYWLSVRAYKTRVIKIGRARISNHLLLAMIAGMVFVVHPIQTQAVTYIVQRMAAMTTMFYVFALLGYAQYRSVQDVKKKKIWAISSLAATIGAMHSKEIAVTLPLMILVIELFFFNPSPKTKKWWAMGVDWSALVKQGPLLSLWLITILIIPAYTLGVRDLIWHVQSEPSSVAGDTFFDKVNLAKVRAVSAETTQISRKTYLLTQINVVRTYLRLVVWPQGQNIDHDYPLTDTIKDGPTMFSLLLHGAMGLLAWGLWFKGKKVGGLGIVFFYVTLLPESSVIPIIDIMFEHRLYLPMVGVALLAGDLGQMAQGGVSLLGSGKKRIDLFVLATVALMIIVLAAAGFKRNAVWKDEISLWTDAREKSPNKARPYNNLGKGYLDRRMFDEAKELYNREIELDQTSVSGHNNLGSIYGVQGNYEEAINEIEKALEINPKHDPAYNNLGNIYMMKGRLAEAEEAYKKSIALNTKDAGVYRNLGDVLIKQGKYDGAAQAYQRAVSMVPGQALWHNKLGAVYGELGQSQEAKNELQIARQLNPQLASVYSNMGNVLANEDSYEEAAKMYATYLQLAPGDTAIMGNLAKVFMRLGNQDKAVEVWQAILRIEPDNEEAKTFLMRVKKE